MVDDRTGSITLKLLLVISFHFMSFTLLQAVQQCVTVNGKSTTQLQLQLQYIQYSSCTTWVWTNRYRHCWTKTMPFLSPSAASWWSDRSQVPYRSSHCIVMMSLHRITHVLSHSHRQFNFTIIMCVCQITFVDAIVTDPMIHQQNI